VGRKPVVETERARLFQTAEFAHRAGVTVRTLHHYDRLGLLRPSRRTDSGYRLYSEREFARLQQIVTLKFIGMNLRDIKRLVERGPADLSGTLRAQHAVLLEKRRQFDAALRAVAHAERILERKGSPDWEAFRKIIEVIEMQKDTDWTNKYYDAESKATIAARAQALGTDAIRDGERKWAELIREVEAAKDEDPASPRARELAKRWQALIEEFTGGDRGVSAGLQRLWADQGNWPTTFKKPYSDAAGDFICRAIAAAKNAR
jgi:DNA-binding transcriptional MerR regulator